MKQHMILGKNLRDVEARRDEWLSENPEIRIVHVHRPMREPDSWLTRLGGRDVPRVSITVEYEQVESDPGIADLDFYPASPRESSSEGPGAAEISAARPEEPEPSQPR